jgi:drug/metabolite transporter (DMT)-like permease
MVMDSVNYIGMAAALATSVFWAMSSIFFSVGGKHLGSIIVNRIRLMFAVAWLLIMHTILYGTPVPLDASPTRWMWFALSGIVGLAIGDAFLFQGYILVGPRITTLFMASVPVISTIFGMVFFHENLMLLEWVGILVTMAGIGIVLLDGKNNPAQGVSEKDHNRKYLLGVGCGVGAALGQAIGLALSKNGLTDGFPSLSGTLMRMISAFAVIWLIALFTGKARSSLQETSQQPKGLIAIMLGSIVGPFLGVWTSMIATQSEMLGISATLMSLTPVFVLPFVYFFFKERVSRRAIAGTIVALIGISILLLTRAGFFG